VGEYQNATARFTDHRGGFHQLLFQALQVVVLVDVMPPHVQADAIQQAGVNQGIVNDDIVAATQGVDDGHKALVAVIKHHGILFIGQFGQFRFEFFVQTGLTRHDPVAHRIGQAPLVGVGYIDGLDVRIHAQPQVITDVPVKYLAATKLHACPQGTFQFGIGEITVQLAGQFGHRFFAGPYVFE